MHQAVVQDFADTFLISLHSSDALWTWETPWKYIYKLEENQVTSSRPPDIAEYQKQLQYLTPWRLENAAVGRRTCCFSLRTDRSRRQCFVKLDHFLSYYKESVWLPVILMPFRRRREICLPFKVVLQWCADLCGLRFCTATKIFIRSHLYLVPVRIPSQKIIFILTIFCGILTGCP